MRTSRTLIATASLFLCTFSSIGYAQKAPTTGGGSKGTTAIPSTTVPMPTSPMQQMLIYSSKVHISGPPLQDAAKVVARCYGGRSQAAIYSAFTDLKGNFSMTFGPAGSSAPMDASEGPIDPMMSSVRTGSQMMQCDVTASASGYISSQITVQFRSSLDMTEIGKLTLQPVGGVQDMGGVVSLTSLSAPMNAQHEYAKGMEELRDGKEEKAEKHFRKAIEQYPKYAVAWEKLGKIQVQDNNRPEARQSFQKAIDADSKYVPPYIALATIDAEDSKWDSVLELTNKAISIDGQHFSAAYFLNAAANYNSDNIPLAEKAALRAEELDKQQHQQPRIELLLAEIFNRQGRANEAAEHFRKFLELDPNSKEADGVRTKLAKLEVAASK
jgi:tetratricopeptide (TPR) repeat protein